MSNTIINGQNIGGSADIFATNGEMKQTWQYNTVGAKELIENLCEMCRRSDGREFNPFCVAEFHFYFGDVQLNYCGDGMFSVLDKCDPNSGKPHGYPKFIDSFYDENSRFDAEAFCFEILRELNYIRTIHMRRRN